MGIRLGQYAKAFCGECKIEKKKYYFVISPESSSSSSHQQVRTTLMIDEVFNHIILLC
jgi:hypothetical protein